MDSLNGNNPGTVKDIHNNMLVPKRGSSGTDNLMASMKFAPDQFWLHRVLEIL